MATDGAKKLARFKLSLESQLPSIQILDFGSNARHRQFRPHASQPQGSDSAHFRGQK